MGAAALGPLVRYLRRLGTTWQAPEDADAVLLRRFAASGDEGAFAALVERHGPMVWGVCVRQLQRADAEDAFQATFLVLVRRAAGLRRPEALGPWLYGVARRVVLKVRTGAARKRECPLETEPPAGSDGSQEAPWRDLRPVLDDEVGRLPERYRAPFVLCYLEGLTNEEAARQLGCPKGTVLSRLARARERLRERLSRRGVALTGAALATVLEAGPADAAVPAEVAASTVRACLALISGTTATSTALALAMGVLQAMWIAKMKMVAAAVLALGVLGAGASLFAWRSPAQEPKPGLTAAPAPVKDRGGAAAPVDSKGGPPVHRDLDLIETLNQVVPFSGFDDPKTTLAEALDILAKRFNVTFDINENAFAADNLQDVVKFEIAAPNPVPEMKAPLATVLRKVLSRLPVESGTTVLVRDHVIEITTQKAVRGELGIADDRQLLPLVFLMFEEEPLKLALRKLAEASGMTVVLDAQSAKDKGATPVTATFKNVPVDTAARVLADSADLGLVRLDNVLYVTTTEKAARLRAEQPAPHPANPASKPASPSPAPKKGPSPKEGKP